MSLTVTVPAPSRFANANVHRKGANVSQTESANNRTLWPLTGGSGMVLELISPQLAQHSVLTVSS